MTYQNGELVEICSKEEGFVGSYYIAEIILPVEKPRFLVEYKTLLTQDEKRLLREIVSADDIRPYPPTIQVSEFSLLDRVDANHNDGWWVGVITKIEKPMYQVYFERTGECISYLVSQLRIHQELENGIWVSSQ
ncbi:hypothetical protein NE237_032977 [Protea cynaroides]|uniref:Agenet domain-containing protein n=1 Tax=Protea cynaroides TaxID=273540 RepID=A0A9Q0R460_9MAGN|nr:hypothetical protein NE237_032977 [Protea cynaroides]